MLQSKLFTKTRKEAPKDEVSKNAELLIRGGFIHKEMAGVYSYLPLGLRVIKKIENIIREEINGLGGQEIFMSTFHPKEKWVATGRWNTMDDLYKVKDSSGREVAIGPTHEEIVVPIAREYVSSYKDLPFSLYQFQNKFRMELRAKSGILRGREFLMKDLYSFSKDEKEHNDFYEKSKIAYKKIFERAGIGSKTYITFASGGTFSKYSQEFQTLAVTGEDTIHICEKCKVAVNEEIIAEQKVCPECDNDKLQKEKAIEVGNIFNLGTKFSDAFDLVYLDEKGEKKKVIMGCYGIGIGRLMGTIVEVLSDKDGIVWPKEVAPFSIHLVELGDSAEVRAKAEDIMARLEKEGIDVLYDDREVRPGEKFADSDLLGMPYRLVISERSLKEGKVEIKERKTGEMNMVSEKELFDKVFLKKLIGP
ncbi:MAG: prolyl-tRNA synthetase [Parcubacteria group bacterium]|nr:prolyl-tRNA synthetase [Parcubacteria group bacterium]